MLKPLFIALAILTSMLPWVIAHAEETSPLIKPFKAHYNILHKSYTVGTGTRELKYLDDGFAQYNYKTDIEWLIFSDTRTEQSIVKLVNGKIVPTRYIYKREGTGTDKFYDWKYEVDKNRAIDVKKDRIKQVDFPKNIQDKLSYHFQNRLNLIANPKQQRFVYPVISTSGSIKNYAYEYDGEEEIMLPYGLINTIRLKREVIKKQRVTYVWFAPELNYLLVKLYQAKGSVEQFEVQLTSLDQE